MSMTSVDLICFGGVGKTVFVSEICNGASGKKSTVVEGVGFVRLREPDVLVDLTADFLSSVAAAIFCTIARASDSVIPVLTAFFTQASCARLVFSF